MNTFEITVQRKLGANWPVVVEQSASGIFLPVRHEGTLQLDLVELTGQSTPRMYGALLGKALFRDQVRDAFVQALTRSDDRLHVMLFIEDTDLRTLRWERLCAPLDDCWDFLGLNQRVPFSLYLPSMSSQRFQPIGRQDLRGLILVASPNDPKNAYRLAPFDAADTVAGVQAALGEIQTEVLAAIQGAAGPPTLDALCELITAERYTLLHIVCHGWYNSVEGKTILYLAKADGTVDAVVAERLLERLGRLREPRGLPHFTFLSTCESAVPEAEGALGGLAHRLVRDLGMPAVVAMTDKVPAAMALALGKSFYRRLREHGEVDRALVEAVAGLAGHYDVNVPVLCSRLGGRPLFSDTLDRPLTRAEIAHGLSRAKELLSRRGPVLLTEFDKHAKKLSGTLETDPTQLSPAAREDREQALTAVRKVCEEALDLGFAALALGQEPPPYDERCPFRGMQHFRVEDREFFFGREDLVTRLEGRLAEANFLAVLGPSGSGKSSVVLAGLVAVLQSKGSALQMAYLTPGSDPLDCLEAVLRANQRASLLVVDQFEELFTLCTDDAERRGFLDRLLELPAKIGVVLTMRADFWGDCASYSELKDMMQACQELIAPMDATELRRGMEMQAARVGLRFEADLSNTILDDVQGEPGAMPLLQHALLELWKRRHGRWLRAEEYRALGRVTKAIAETAEAVYRKLSSDDQERVRDIFARLTRLDEEALNTEERRHTRQRVDLHELTPAGSDAAQVRTLVNLLADARLIVTSRNAATDTEEVEIAHEALIRYWPRLRGYLAEDFVTLRLREGVREAAREWREKDKDESLLVHRGLRLQEAETLREHPRFRMNEVERDYVDACVELREKEKAVRDRSRRVILLISTAGFVLAISLASFAGVKWHDAYNLAATATRAKEDAERQYRTASAQRLAAHANAAFMEGYPQRSLLLAVEALQVTLRKGEPRVPAAETTLRQILADVGGRPLSWPKGGIAPVVISQDSRTLVTRDSEGVRAWTLNNLAAPPVVLEGRHQDLAFSFDNRWLVTRAKDQTSRVWDLNNLAAKPALVGMLKSRLHAMAISCNGRWLVTGNDDGTAQVRDLNKPSAEPRVLGGHKGEIHTVTISPNSGRLVTTSHDETSRVWDLNTPTTPPIVLPTAYSQDMIFSADSRYLVVPAESGAVRYDLHDPNPVAKCLDFHYSLDGRLKAAAFSQDGEWLVLGGIPLRPLVLIQLAGSDSKGRIFYESPLCLARFTPDSKRLITVAKDWTALLRDLSDSEVRHWLSEGPALLNPVVFRGHESRVHTVEVSPDCKRLVTGSDDQTTRVWDLTDPVAMPLVLREYERGRLGGPAPVRALAISPDSQQILMVKANGTARLQKRSDASIRPAALGGTDLRAVAITPDGRRWISADKDGTTRVWDLNDPTPKPVILRDKSGDTDGVALSPDGRWLVTVNAVGKAQLWDLNGPMARLDLVRGIEGGKIQALAISPDARRLVTVSKDGMARLWDLRDPAAQAFAFFGGEGDKIQTVAISPDGRQLATAGEGGTARLRNLEDLDAEHVVFPGFQAKISCLAISPDNHWLMAGCDDGNIRLWDLRLDALIGLAGKTAGRNLTLEEWKVYFPGEPYRPTFLDVPFPEYETRLDSIARNLTRDEWERYFSGHTYRKTFPDRPEPDGF
jgi:WD40 repeat protein